MEWDWILYLLMAMTVAGGSNYLHQKRSAYKE